MSEASQIVAGVVILQQNDLAQHQAFLARPFGRITAIQLSFSIGLKGICIPASTCLVVQLL
tara:strand:- start:50 stop:232 length:183 start_codon:yes stop_codon:yes gene_type:complete